MQKLDNLSNLKDLCIKILDQLSANIVTYINDANKSYDDFANNASQENSNYDHLVDSLTSVLKHSIHLSGHLNGNALCNYNDNKPHSTTDKKPHATTTNLGKEKNLENVQGSHGESTTNYVTDSEKYKAITDNFAESESIKCKQVQPFTAYPYERRDIKEYEVNHVITCVITSVNKNSFCICPTDWKVKFLELTSFVNASNLKKYDEAPPLNEVFGIFKQGEGVWRAIRTSDVYTNAQQCFVYDAILLDFGENVTEYLKTQTYQLREEIKQIPAQVVECFLKQEEVLDDVRSKLYNAIVLRVVENFGNGLLVEVVDDADETISNDIRCSDNNNNLSDDKTLVEQSQIELNKSDCDEVESTKESSLETVVEQPQMKLSKADWDMLHEEPLGTDNAMKAVCGYVPTDEARICPFYDPSTGNCFKGSRCRLEHTLLNKEGYTKDLLPTNNVTVMNTEALLFLYQNNQQLLITPIYIMSLTHFYAHIGETSDEVFIWNEDALPNDCGLDHIPHTLELVLARFEDNLYYRAQIIEQVNEQMFKVFYIDYGNESIVNITDMACVDELNTVAPAQAVLCRIANVEACVDYMSDQYNCGREFLQSRIIDQSIVVEVIDHQHEDLVVRILEPSFQNLPNEMIKMGFLKQY